MALEFSDVVMSESEIREVMGTPSQRALRKQITHLDQHARAFIARSPFLLLASCDADGRMDVSPKGDPPGFVQVLDDHTLGIPDRLGNRRADTFRNLLQRPGIGLLLLVPGKEETLRINGKARIVRDRWVREPMTMNGKLPDFAIVVGVEEVFFHCAKCVIRSKLWDSKAWPQLDGLASLAEALVEQAKLPEGVEETHALLERDKRERLY